VSLSKRSILKNACTCMTIWITCTIGLNLSMRTTVEITEEQRAELLKMAAVRGYKGFSQVVQEALNEYISRQSERQNLIKEALKLKGVLSEKDSNDLDKSRKLVRGTWR
jgi:3-dehydroquinate synthetase